MAAAQGNDKIGFRRVLVVDDDEVARNLIANYLSDIGVTEIELQEDGEAAWQQIKTRRFDLIVLDWKLPKLSGLALFNRVRRRADYRTTPIMVVSGLLEKHDFRLLQEFPCTALMEKPFTRVLFENRVEELDKEAIWYAQNVMLVDTILEAVKHDGKKAEQVLRQVLKQAPNPIPLALVAARRLTKSKLLKSSQAVLEAVLKVDPECVLASTELGRTLHLQGQHQQALEALRGATKISPQNLERLCLMGEVELNLQDPEAARAYFEKALAVDPEDSTANAGMVVAGNLQELLEAPQPMQLPRSFASLLNSIGVGHVRSGNFTKGIEQYQAAMAFLSDRDDAARVAFNLGLGFLRWGKPAEALPWFQKSESLAPETFGKSAGYVRQLLLAGSAGEVVDAADDREAAFGRVAPPMPTVADAGPPPSGTMHDDVEVGGSGDNVIPFPKDPKEKAKEKEAPAGNGEHPEEEDEPVVDEAVGAQVVL